MIYPDLLRSYISFITCRGPHLLETSEALLTGVSFPLKASRERNRGAGLHDPKAMNSMLLSDCITIPLQTFTFDPGIHYHGCNLHDRHAIFTDFLPVGGSGFLVIQRPNKIIIPQRPLIPRGSPTCRQGRKCWHPYCNFGSEIATRVHRQRPARFHPAGTQRDDLKCAR